MSTKYYFNLTNGIESLEDVDTSKTPFGFIRIQSTWCERKEWLKILQDLDYDFLLHLALGTNVLVYDFGAKKDKSRATYQGIEWVKYALNRFWFGIQPNSIKVKNSDATDYFEHSYDQIFIYNSTKEKETLKKKLNYFKKFLNTTEIKLIGLSKYTDKDQSYNYYFDVLKRKLC